MTISVHGADYFGTTTSVHSLILKLIMTYMADIYLNIILLNVCSFSIPDLLMHQIIVVHRTTKV